MIDGNHNKTTFYTPPNGAPLPDTSLSIPFVQFLFCMMEILVGKTNCIHK